MVKSLLDTTESRSDGLRRHKLNLRLVLTGYVLLVLVALAYYQGWRTWDAYRVARLPPHAAASLARCRSLTATPGPAPDFHKRTQSDRFVPGTKPVLLKNAKIWTGDANGTEVIDADVLLDKGIIKGIGKVRNGQLKDLRDELVVIDVKGAWVTPGIVDVHSHLGDSPSPELNGAIDDNSLKGPVQPWLRALDGLNTHDDSFPLSISGGVTTALVLPGSANAIGGQGFTIKLRSTSERSPSSMLLEPPYQINSSFPEDIDRPRWRQMKHACGENPSGVYGFTRMDTIWGFREAYNKAREIKASQDQYCQNVLNGDWSTLTDSAFPEDLQWEALVDVLRGRVKVQVHCYETVDLDDIVRLSNEFQFPIAAFHHAHEAYLVPDTLNKAYDHPPAVAMFATNARYKREAYRGSEFAPRVLAKHGLQVVMKSDHPVLDSRHLLYEAQQAYVYGLPENLAIAAVTSTPAEVMGMGHRIGYIKEGWDADLVIWDSHPLALGATPTQVFIDGIPQLENPHVVEKPKSFQDTPKVPNFDKEAEDAVKYEGLPPLEPEESKTGIVVFTNVKSVFTREAHDIHESFHADSIADYGLVIVNSGSITCSGTPYTCLSSRNLLSHPNTTVVDLKGGSVGPGLTTYGAPLGLEEIESEASTNDGRVLDPLVSKVPKVVGGDGAIVRAVDGLQFGGRNALLAYRSGVTTGIVAPTHRHLFSGLSTTFSTGAPSKLTPGAIIQEVNAVHVSVRHFGKTPSVSMQIAALRRLLVGSPREVEGEVGRWFRSVALGETTLVIDADSADIIATLVLLKKEIEQTHGSKLKLTISGALEAHLLAKELAEANVGVVQVPSRPFPTVWERRRILPGPPLTQESSLLTLLKHNVTVGIGIEEAWSARNTRFDLGWAAIEAGGQISKTKAISLASTDLEKLLGVEVETQGANGGHDLVATVGGDILDMESKVVAVISSRRGIVDLL
ncbi:carbohydrate esterase family 9 protein [Panus rudis PR-1116 ss-1]|nr:carbohydrate esterase family 9 protein [Panus rudis PR-1116 ss-1]